MRIAFVLQTFKAVDQITRLVRTLNMGCPDRLIVISHNGPLEALAHLTTDYGVDMLLRSSGGRGRFELFKNYLTALQWLREQPRDYDWIVLLSGQDYPIRSLKEFQDTLASSRVDGYFAHFDPFDPHNTGAASMNWPMRMAEDRYLFTYRLLKADVSRLDRIVLKVPRHLIDFSRNYRLHTSFGIMLGKRAANPPFSARFKCFGGNYWHIIRRQCGEAILDFVRDRPDVIDYYRNVIVPEESLPQSILLNDERFTIAPEELRYYDFGRSQHGHPKMLQAEDLEAAYQGSYFFARKFDFALGSDFFDMLDRRALS